MEEKVISLSKRSEQKQPTGSDISDNLNRTKISKSQIAII